MQNVIMHKYIGDIAKAAGAVTYAGALLVAAANVTSCGHTRRLLESGMTPEQVLKRYDIGNSFFENVFIKPGVEVALWYQTGTPWAL